MTADGCAHSPPLTGRSLQRDLVVRRRLRCALPRRGRAGCAVRHHAAAEDLQPPRPRAPPGNIGASRGHCHTRRSESEGGRQREDGCASVAARRRVQGRQRADGRCLQLHAGPRHHRGGLRRARVRKTAHHLPPKASDNTFRSAVLPRLIRMTVRVTP